MQLANGDVLSSPEEVHNGAVWYFQDFLSEKGPNQWADLSCLEPIILSGENETLISDPTEEEILGTLKSIPKQSIPVHNIFGIAFYTSC